MIDESLLAKVANLSPADRLELIGAVWDTLSPDDLPVTALKEHCLMLDWLTWKCIPTIRVPGPK